MQLEISCSSYSIKRVKNATKNTGRIPVPELSLDDEVYIIPMPLNAEIQKKDSKLILSSNFVFRKSVKRYGNSRNIFINAFFVSADVLVVPVDSLITTELTTEKYIVKESTDRKRIYITNECFYSQVVTSLPYIPLENGKLKVEYLQTKIIYDSEKYSSVEVPYPNVEFLTLIDDLEEY